MEIRMPKAKEYIRICPECGKEFSTLNKRKVYCCDNCKASAYRNRHRVKSEKICPICGKKFVANRSIDVYCSRECYEESKVIYRRTHRVLKKQTEKICPVCGKKFIGKSSRKVYCSRDCKTDRGAWHDAVQAVTRVGHDLATKQENYYTLTYRFYTQISSFFNLQHLHEK